MRMTPGSATVHDISWMEAHVASEKASSLKKSAMRIKEATQPLGDMLESRYLEENNRERKICYIEPTRKTPVKASFWRVVI